MIQRVLFFLLPLFIVMGCSRIHFSKNTFFPSYFEATQTTLLEIEKSSPLPPRNTPLDRPLSESKSKLEIAFFPDEKQKDPGLKVFQALLEAYPAVIKNMIFDENDWSITVNGQRFFWSQGRLLPAEEKERYQEYSPYSFRPYPDILPPLAVLSPKEKKILQSRLAEREKEQYSRHQGFMQALWGMTNYAVAEKTVVKTQFLGSQFRVNPLILNPLKNVEKKITLLASRDPVIQDWLKNLDRIDSYVWRKIAGSANRSLHSYGIAIDLILTNYRGKNVYWRWSRDFHDEWWAIPYKDRLKIPSEIIQAFEDFGFIWGGKWFLFDQIHFEYRPELMLLEKSSALNK